MPVAEANPERRAPLVRSFSTLQDAVDAQDALAAAGIARELLELTVLEDEAGPASGNFLIGNGCTNHGSPPGPVRSGGDVPYDENFRDTAYRGGFILTLHQLGPSQRALAESVLARFDSVAVNDVARAGERG
jgi:hypothetical protein